MWVSKSIHQIGRFRRRTLLFLAALGPGIITMIADNDAGGISTYAQTGAKTGFNLLWAFIILVPMAYYVQEMTVRLGAVTKRGHAEAIFDGFGKFWGWFSIFDLALINWLTLVTEYIGMTQALRLFNIPEWVTFLAVTLLLLGIVITGRYWTFEKVTFFFCLFNLVYIPAAIWAMKTGNVAGGWSAVGKGFFSPHFTFSNTFTPVALLTLIMANIGTTITPWQIFFQQSAVVDKGMDVGDIKAGKIDTFIGSLMTCVVAAFIIIATAGVFHFNPDPDPKWRMVDSAAQTAAAMPEVMPNGHWGQWAKTLFAIGLFDAGLLGRMGSFTEHQCPRSALVLCRLRSHADVGRRRIPDCVRRSPERHYYFCTSRRSNLASRGADLLDSTFERQAVDGRSSEHSLAKHCQLGYYHLRNCCIHRLRPVSAVSRIIRRLSIN